MIGAAMVRVKWFRLLAMIAAITSADGTTAAAALTVQTPLRAASFANDLGVGLHLGAYGGPYGSLPNVLTALQFIGVTHLRDSMKTTSWDIARMTQLGSAGEKFDVILQAPPSSYQYLDQIAGYLDSIEGPDEVDEFNFSYAGLTAIPAGVALQKLLYPQIQNDPALTALPVLNFTIGDWANTALAGNLSAYSDNGNFHFYPPYGWPPEKQLPTAIAETTDVPGKPTIVTEFGYSTVIWNLANAPTGGSSGVSESIQAKYLLDGICDTIIAGIPRTYLYELVDDTYDDDDTDRDYHYGLFRTDWSPKPSAVALNVLQSILSDTAANASSFQPTKLTYSLVDSSGSGPINLSSHSLVFQKSTGAWFLVIWTEPELWDSTDHVAMAAAPTHSLTLTVPKPMSTIKVFDPLTGTSAVTSLTKGVSNTATVSFTITDHPIVVELIP